MDCVRKNKREFQLHTKHAVEQQQYISPCTVGPLKSLNKCGNLSPPHCQMNAQEYKKKKIKI